MYSVITTQSFRSLHNFYPQGLDINDFEHELLIENTNAKEYPQVGRFFHSDTIRPYWFTRAKFENWRLIKRKSNTCCCREKWDKRSVRKSDTINEVTLDKINRLSIGDVNYRGIFYRKNQQDTFYVKTRNYVFDLKPIYQLIYKGKCYTTGYEPFFDRKKEWK